MIADWFVNHGRSESRLGSGRIDRTSISRPLSTAEGTTAPSA